MTITDALVAFPFAYFMARLASRADARAPVRARAAAALVELPRPRLRLAADARARTASINWSLGKLHLPELGVAYSNTAMWIVFSYIWLPFMILPIYAALERIPHSYLEASGDLGARGGRDVPLGRAAARAAGRHRGLDLHLLADARRLHHAGARRRRVVAVHRQRRLRVGRRRRTTSRSRRRSRPCRSPSWPSTSSSRAGSARSRRCEDRVARASGSGSCWRSSTSRSRVICLYAFNSSNVQSWPIAGPDDALVLARRSTTRRCSRRSGCR